MTIPVFVADLTNYFFYPKATGTTWKPNNLAPFGVATEDISKSGSDNLFHVYSINVHLNEFIPYTSDLELGFWLLYCEILWRSRSEYGSRYSFIQSNRMIAGEIANIIIR